jgi:hypothetical protein
MTKPSAAPLYALPPIHAVLPSTLGAVRIQRVPGLKDSNDKDCLGLWSPKERLVKIEAELALTAAWHTLWHEWVHVVMWDAGLVGLRNVDEERIADVVASARVYEMVHAR